MHTAAHKRRAFFADWRLIDSFTDENEGDFYHEGVVIYASQNPANTYYELPNPRPTEPKINYFDSLSSKNI